LVLWDFAASWAVGVAGYFSVWKGRVQTRPYEYVVQFNREKHHRRSIRLPGYNYAQAGAYFVTVCAQNRECLFGEIVDGKMRLKDAGRMVGSVWEELPRHYAGIDIDAFVVMPNHVHGIIILRDHHVVGATPRGCPTSGQAQGPAPTMSLPDVVHRFKSLTTARYRQGVAEKGWPPFCRRLWQRNYYEHVIRGEDELNRIRRYIEDNPTMWQMDRENPEAQTAGERESWRV